MKVYRNPTYKPMTPGGEAPVLAEHKANMSAANGRSNEYPAVKTSGIKIRGTGAATRGVMARGPMA